MFKAFLKSLWFLWSIFFPPKMRNFEIPPIWQYVSCTTIVFFVHSPHVLFLKCFSSDFASCGASLAFRPIYNRSIKNSAWITFFRTKKWFKDVPWSLVLDHLLSYFCCFLLDSWYDFAAIEWIYYAKQYAYCCTAHQCWSIRVFCFIFWCGLSSFSALEKILWAQFSVVIIKLHSFFVSKRP